MLWVDQDFLTSTELFSLSKQADRIDTIEGIEVSGSNGVIRRAIDECGGALRSRLKAFGNVAHSDDLSANHIAAVLNTGSSGLRAKYALANVIADRLDGSWSEIQKWVGATAIYLFYRSAVHRTTDDNRYADLMVFWEGEKKKALRTLQGAGVPIVYSPIPAPGAIREVGAGVFASGSVLAGPSGSLSNVAHFVCVTYTGANYQSPTEKHNAESHASAVVSVTPALNDKLTVSIAALSQADPTQLTGFTEWANRITPTGWNVYAGLSAEDLRLQNASPIPIATKTFEIAALETATASLVRGQYPDAFVSIPDQVRHA